MRIQDKVTSDYYDHGLWSLGNIPFSSLVGKTFKNVHGLEDLSNAVLFEFTDGSIYLMTHWQDCCESVSLVDVDNKAENLIGQTIKSAEESESADHDYEWTFYRLRTEDENLCMRWAGSIPSYYSLSVSLQELNYAKARARGLIP